MNNESEMVRYLASRHVDPKLREPKIITEYFCKTCLLNQNIEKYGEFERTHKQTYTPMARKVHKVGVIFTINSAMAEFHFKQRMAHDWGLYQPFLKPNP